MGTTEEREARDRRGGGAVLIGTLSRVWAAVRRLATPELHSTLVSGNKCHISVKRPANSPKAKGNPRLANGPRPLGNSGGRSSRAAHS